MSQTRNDGDSRDPAGGGVEELSPEARELLERLLAERRAGQRPAPASGTASASVAPAAGHVERFPISAAQRRLWRLGTLAEGTPWGNLPLTFWVRGPLRTDPLEAALRDLLDRQSVLRTRYRDVGEGVFGALEESATLVLETGPPASRSKILARVRERASRALDPGRESLFQAAWLPLSADQGPEREGMLLLLTHHLVTDGWSLGLMLRELSQAYAARVEGRAPDLPRLKVSFADLAGAEPAGRTPSPQGIAYWKDRLADAPREVPLPRVGGTAGPGAFKSAKVDGAVSVQASASLRKLAAATRVTPFGAWLGIFQTLLGRYTGEYDVVVGTTVSIRDTADRERLVGNFGNNVLLRTRLHGIATLGEVLSGLRETLPRDLAHQAVELEDLLRGRGKTPRVPRLNVLFMLRDGSPAEHLALPGCSIEYVPTPVGSLALDLALDVFDRGDRGFSFSIEHRLARVDQAGAEALARDLEQLVEAIVDHLDLPLEDLPIRHGLWAAASEPSASAPRLSVESARRAAVSRDGDPGMTESEAFLARLWCEALDLEDVSPHDNFFELGGHSLLAINVLEEIEEKRGLRLTPVDFVSETLAQLAASLAEAEPNEVRPVGSMGRVLPAPRGTTLEPVRLADGRLSAMLHAPADGAPRSFGIICPPVLYEHQLCQRTLRSLAERLAAEGIVSLRLDYRGVGDSGGDLSDATLDAWSEDIRTAEEFLTVEYGVPEFRFGLRVGATLALATEAEGDRTMFAWAPILDGAAYVAKLEATHADWYRRYGVHHGRHADEGSATGRVLGQPLSESARASLGAIRLDPAPINGGALVVIETEGCELRPDERSALEGFAPAHTTWSVPGPAPWLEDPDAVSPAVPARALEQIAAGICEALP